MQQQQQEMQQKAQEQVQMANYREQARNQAMAEQIEGRNDFLKKYNNGQVIYHNLPDQTVITQKTSPANNILTDLARNFKTKLFDYLIKK